MKTLPATVLLLIALMACHKSLDNGPLATGRVVRYETTVDSEIKNPRLRWLIDVAPLSFEGLGGRTYQQIKAFDLPDTTVYKAGQLLKFHYHLVPYAQQTPWQTFAERFSVPAAPSGVTALPELTLSDVQQ